MGLPDGGPFHRLLSGRRPRTPGELFNHARRRISGMARLPVAIANRPGSARNSGRRSLTPWYPGRKRQDQATPRRVWRSRPAVEGPRPLSCPALPGPAGSLIAAGQAQNRAGVVDCRRSRPSRGRASCRPAWRPPGIQCRGGGRSSNPSPRLTTTIPGSSRAISTPSRSSVASPS